MERKGRQQAVAITKLSQHDFAFLHGERTRTVAIVTRLRDRPVNDLPQVFGHDHDLFTRRCGRLGVRR